MPAARSRTLAALRQRAPHAAYDDRLLTRAGQAHVLGSSLDVDAYVDLALASRDGLRRLRQRAVAGLFAPTGGGPAREHGAAPLATHRADVCLT